MVVGTLLGFTVFLLDWNKQSSRVKKFELREKSGGAWLTIHKGAGIGAHFKTTFAPVTTSAIRLNIFDATEGPTISKVSLICIPSVDLGF